jgi:glycosyltransferase involved in cell wall biosynthesis
MKVFIDPSCDIQYSSFYIYGLYQIYGRRNVRFSSNHFKKFKHQNHFFAFIVIDSENTKNIIIDFTDSSTIDENALSWCDVYGKINYDSNLNDSNKIMAIGPSFGIQIYNLIETLSHAILNLFRAYGRIPNKRKFLSDYKAQYNRPKYSDYCPKPSRINDVFFMASLWKQEPKTNRFRANYIKSCRVNPQVNFEGGFAPRTKNDVSGFEDLTATRRVSMAYYLEKIKNSALVFNTPAVKSCHGWKLAEYLCLGKAILTTPLSRELPKLLQEGKDVIFTNGSIDDITIKVNTILSDSELRQTLETQAKQYFEYYLAPQVVIKRLLDK